MDCSFSAFQLLSNSSQASRPPSPSADQRRPETCRTSNLGEEFHTATGRLARCWRGTVGPGGRPCSELQPPHQRPTPRRRQGRRPRPRAVGAPTPRAGAAPTLRFRRPPGPRPPPPPPPPAPPLVSPSSTRTPGPRAPRPQNSGRCRRRSGTVGEGRAGTVGPRCTLGSGGPGLGCRVSRAASRHPPAGVPPSWPRRPILSSFSRNLPSLSVPSALTTRLRSPQPALQLQLGFRGPGSERLAHSCAPRRNRTAGPALAASGPTDGRCRSAVGFPLDRAARVGGAPGRRSLAGVVFNPVSSPRSCPAETSWRVRCFRSQLGPVSPSTPLSGRGAPDDSAGRREGLPPLLEGAMTVLVRLQDKRSERRSLNLRGASTHFQYLGVRLRRTPILQKTF